MRLTTLWLHSFGSWRICAVVGAFLLASGPSAASAGLIVNGDFESQPNFGNPDIYAVLAGNDIPGWTIESGHAVTVHHSSITSVSWGGEAMIAGEYSVNTDGEGINANNANLYQDFNTTAGAGYILEFDWKRWEWATSPTTQLQVSLTDTVTSTVLFNGLYSVLSNNRNVLQHVTHEFLGTGNAIRLRIQESPQSATNDNNFIVDNFSVEQVNAVPEPSTLTLCGFGAMGLFFTARKSRCATSNPLH